MYRDLPLLGKTKNKKDVAHEKLVETIEEINPKINALSFLPTRTIESKDSMSSGKLTRDVYLPNLCYFNNIDILRDQATRNL